jgi:hypothetical protein
MIYVIYVFAAVFVLLGCGMLYVFYRERHFGMFLMGVTYGCSGLMAFTVAHWWPLIAGFVLVWMLKMLGLEMGLDGKDEGATPDAGTPGGSGTKDEGKT